MRAIVLAVTGLALILGTGAVCATEKHSQSGAYRLKPEWAGPCRQTDVVDIDLGNAPEIFIRAATCQVTGQEPGAAAVEAWSVRLRTEPELRRLDVIKAICAQAHRACIFRYSDPWVDDRSSSLIDCVKRGRRDIGAVVIFFFHCPEGSNCRMDWAGGHAPGMAVPDKRLGFGDETAGYYDASNPGFWAFELRGAREAGLQFILPNLYGPDMAEGRIDTLVTVLKAGAQGPVKIGLFDDTWAWGQKIGGEGQFGEPWARAPDLSDTEAAADTLYRAKWRPFFTKIPPGDWYRIDGRPLIYFYNAGTLKPANRAAAVIARMKAMFKADFGVEPFVAVDDAFFADPDMPKVADSRFRWDTFSDPFSAADSTVTLRDGISRSGMRGRLMASAMARWDSANRDALEDNPQRFAGRTERGPERLQAILDATKNDDSLVVETWNDLGEGTGVNMNYDNYYLGKWQQPNVFIDKIRQSQCTN